MIGSFTLDTLMIYLYIEAERENRKIALPT